MKSAMELLLELDEFTQVDIEDNEDFSNIYIKLKGKRLCKITNYVFDRQDGVYTVMLSNKIYFKQTYEEHLDREIPRNEQHWEEVGLIEFVGKKIDYVSMTPTYKKKYEELKKILEIIKEKKVDFQFFQWCEDVTAYNLSVHKEDQLTQEEYDLIRRKM